MGKMRVFLDTNVAVDFLLQREQFYQDAFDIVSMAIKGNIKAFVSSLTIVNCAYIMRRHFDKEMVMSKIKGFMKIVETVEIGTAILNKAIDCNPYDFEDAVQYFSALAYKPDIIITRDKRGFQDFGLPVMMPAEFIAECQA